MHKPLLIEAELIKATRRDFMQRIQSFRQEGLRLLDSMQNDLAKMKIPDGAKQQIINEVINELGQ